MFVLKELRASTEAKDKDPKESGEATEVPEQKERLLWGGLEHELANSSPMACFIFERGRRCRLQSRS